MLFNNSSFVTGATAYDISYDSVEDELTWYATQEIGDYLQSVGNK